VHFIDAFANRSDIDIRARYRLFEFGIYHRRTLAAVTVESMIGIFEPSKRVVMFFDG
jgi:hypothetical protein